MSVALAATMFALIAVGPAPSAAGTIKTQGFIIDYADIPDSTARIVARDAEQALRDVTGFLGLPQPSEPIHIKISKDYRFPRAWVKDRIMQVPANRFGPKGAQSGPRAIWGTAWTAWHGVANVLAPSAHPAQEWGRFLTEGLSACLQSKFGGKAPTPWPKKFYPTMGQGLNEGTLALEAEVGALSMEDAKGLVNDRKLTRTRQLAWIQAGSFICFLIETRGLDAYLKWHRGQTFQESYGDTLKEAELQWRKFIAEVRS